MTYVGAWLLAVMVVTLADGEGGWRVPRDESGEKCPWPFDPALLVGAPMGQYHCPYCGSMQLAGIAHLDYGGASFPRVNNSG